MVGIWSEFGRNDSESESNLGGLSLTSHSYQIPTIPTIALGFRSEFGRIRSECVGESKVLQPGPQKAIRSPGSNRCKEQLSDKCGSGRKKISNDVRRTV